MKNTLESVQDLIACFKWDFSIDKDGNPKICPPKPGRDVPIETWSPVLIALKKFMDGDASTLDEAFGGQSASQRRFINREAERNRIKWLVESFSSDYKEPPKNDKHLGVSPKEFGIAEVAKMFGMTESAVRSIYNGDR
jgi:hypothetical protein